MHARVVSYIGQFGKNEEIIRGFQEQIIPAAERQAGFTGGLLLTDRATGKVIVISLWESEADMVKGEADGYMQAQLARIQRLAASTPTLEHFEVSTAISFMPRNGAGAVPASADGSLTARQPGD